MRKAIFIKNQNQIWKDLSEKLKKKHNIIPVMWLGGTHDEYKNGVLFYSHKSAILLKDPIKYKKDLNLGLNLDEIELISKNTKLFFNLINRWSVFSDKIAYENKLEYFIKSYEKWKNIDNQINFDFVISPTIPHRLYDFSLYLYCQYKKKKIIMGNQTTDINFDDKKKEYKSLFFYQDKIENIKILNTNIRPINNKELFEKYVIKVKNEPSTYMTKNLERDSSRSFFEYLKYNFFFVILKYFYYKLFQIRSDSIFLKFDNFLRKENLPELATKSDILIDNYKKRKNFLRGKKFYKNNCQNFENFKDKNYVIFFGGKIPERSNNPDSGLYFNEEMTINLILSKIPENFLLVYREHPSCFNNTTFVSDKDINFYSRLKNISDKIIFTSPNENRIELIKSAKAACNLSGTAAWESALLNIPSFNFGGNWFNETSEILKIKSEKDLDFFFNEKIKSNVNLKKIEDFFYKTLKNTYTFSLREINSKTKNYNEIIDQHCDLIIKQLES